MFFAGGTVTIALVLARGRGDPDRHDDGADGGHRGRRRGDRRADAAARRCSRILGPRINSLKVRDLHPEEHAKKGLWAKWAHEIAKQPIIAGIAALAILIPLTIPLLSLTLGQQDTAALSKSTTSRQAYDLISQNFGAGRQRSAADRGAARLAGGACERQLESEPKPVELEQVGIELVEAPARARAPAPVPAPARSANSDPRTTDPRLATLQKDVAGTSGVAGGDPDPDRQGGNDRVLQRDPDPEPGRQEDNGARQHAAQRRHPEGGEGHRT